MAIAIAIILIIILVFYMRLYYNPISKTEYLHTNHKNVAYLIHEETSDQCFECRAIRNYFYNALGNQYQLSLHSYHVYEDPEKIKQLEDKYKFDASRTPVLLVVHDDGTHQVFQGYPAVHQAITMLRYHPYIERRLGM